MAARVHDTRSAPASRMRARMLATLAALAAALAVPQPAAAVSAVSNVVATPGDGQVQLDWTNPGDGDFDHVNVYRATGPLDPPTLVQVVAGPANTWTDATVVNGADYWYVLRAATAADVEAVDAAAGSIGATFWNDTSFTTLAGRRLDASINYPASTSDNGFGRSTSFTTRWEGYVYAPTADTYTFYVAKDDGARLWIDGTQVIDSWGCCGEPSVGVALSPGWHAYRLDYYQGSGGWQAIASWQSSTISKEVIPAANLGNERRTQATPTDAAITVTAPNGGETITDPTTTVTWNLAGAASRIAVDYSLDGGATWSGSIDTSLPGGATSVEWTPPQGIDDPGARVRVRAFSQAGVLLASDTSDADFTLDTPPVEPVSDVTATPGGGVVQLSWTNPADPQFDHVAIYRSTSSGDVGSLVHVTPDALTSSWNDLGVTNGTRYWYRVRAVDGAGREGPEITAGRIRTDAYNGTSLNTWMGWDWRTAPLSDGFGGPDSVGPAANYGPDFLDYDTWSLRWSGMLHVPRGDTYHFRAQRRSGARIWVNGTLVLDNWTINDNYYDHTSASIVLPAGWTSLRIEYTHNGNDATATFSWKATSEGTWRIIDPSEYGHETTVEATPTTTATTLTSPDGGEVLGGRVLQPVSWSTVGGDASSVSLWYSLDGGATFPYLIARNQPLTGSFDWLVPDQTSSAQVRVRALAQTATGAIVTHDDSDASFTIDTASAPPPAVQAIDTVPGNGQVFVQWTMPAPLGSTDHVAIYRSATRSGIPVKVHETADSVTSSWVDATVTNGQPYWYSVRTVDAAGREGPRMQAGHLAADYYNGIRFDSFVAHGTETYGFEGGRGFGPDDGPAPIAEAPDYLEYDTWSARWSGWVHAPATDSYRIRTYSRGGNRIYVDGVLRYDSWSTYGDSNDTYTGYSHVQLTQGWHHLVLDTSHWVDDAFFHFDYERTGSWASQAVGIADLAIEESSRAVPDATDVTVVAPNGGEDWRSTAVQTISWTTSGPDVSAVSLWYSVDGGLTYPFLIARNLAPTGTHAWNVPDNVNSTQVRVLARGLNAANITIEDDESDADFTIDTASPPPPSVTDITTVAGDGQVTVQWTMPAPLGTTDHVAIYRRDGAGGTPALVHETTDAVTTSWVDATVVNGTTYTYHVRTVDAAGRENPTLLAGRVATDYFDGIRFDSFVASTTETFGFVGGRGYGPDDGPGPLAEAPDYFDYDTWSAHHSGWFYAPATDSYRIRTYSRGGNRLIIDDIVRYDSWSTYGDSNDAYTGYSHVQLTQGWHRYEYDYSHWVDDAFLYWDYERIGNWSSVALDTPELAVERRAVATPHASDVTITYPNGGETFAGSTYQDITWTSAGTDAANVTLWYSTDGGSSYPYLIARNQPLTGSYAWQVPDGVSSTQVRVRAVAHTAERVTIDLDDSDADFTIDTASPPPPAVTDVQAVAGDGQVTVQWTMPAPLGTTDHVAIYRRDGPGALPQLVHATADAVTTSWVDAAPVNGTTYTYHVRTVDAAGREGPSLIGGQVEAAYYDGIRFDAYIASTIETYGWVSGRGYGSDDGPGPLTEAPDYLDYDTWSVRHTGWLYAPATDTYRIRTYTRGGNRLYVDGILYYDSWSTYGDSNDTYTGYSNMQLTQGWHRFVFDYSHWGDDAFSYFDWQRAGDWATHEVDVADLATERAATATPSNLSITVDSPNGGETFLGSAFEDISWTTSGAGADQVTLWYSTDGGVTYPYLIVRNQPLTGSYAWRVPDSTNSSQVRVRAVAHTLERVDLVDDESDADFTIDTTTPPPTPVGNVTTTPGDSNVVVQWEWPSPIGTATHAKIYRRNTTTGATTLVHATLDTTPTSWTDLAVTNGVEYEYHVRTVDAAGRESPYLVVGRVNAEYYDGRHHNAFLYTTQEGYGFEGGRGFGATDFPISPDYPGESPGGDTWSSRWTGYFYVPVDDTYRIRTYSRGGNRLWVDGVLHYDSFSTYGDSNDAYTGYSDLQLTTGWHAYTVDYSHWGDDAFFYFDYVRAGSWINTTFDTTNLAVEFGSRATPNASTVTLDTPNGGETWTTSLARDIEWTPGSVPPGTTYRLRYSTDAGATFDRIIATNLGSTTQSWKPPDSLNTTTARIMVEAVGPDNRVVASDISDANFTIEPSALDPVSNLTATPGWNEVQLSWTNPISPSFDHVNIYRTEQPWELGTKVQVVASPGSSWTDTSVTNGVRYWYVVRAANALDEETITIQSGGLRGDYFDGADFGAFVGSQVDPSIDFDWGAGGPAVLGGTVDGFSVRWTGYIRADQDALWTLDNNRPTRDGTRMWVDGVQLLNRWNAGDSDSAGTAYMQLAEGWHPITVEYHETTGTAHTAIYHARSGLSRRVVPSTELAMERQATTVPIDPDPPTPDPAGTVTVDSPTQITWSMITVVDTDSGLDPAGAYSYDNGATWEVTPTYSRTGLSPNTVYTQTLRARDAYGNQTAANVLSARTLPIAPTVSANRPTSTWLGPGGQTITFSNLAAFGAGGVEYYRYAFNTNGAHTFDDTETQWNAGNLDRVVSTSGVWYLHLKSYNADDVGGATATIGPFWVDAEAPTPNPPTVATTPTLNTVQFSITPAADTHSGLDAAAYSFDNGATWGATLDDSATGLAPNTVASRQVRVRDAIGNVTGTTSVSAATLPVDPGVTTVPASGATWHPGGTTVSLTSTIAFGPGTLWGYRWRLTSNAADPVLDADPAWTSGSLGVPIAATGQWYVRVRSYNSTAVGGNELTLGPFNVDATPPPGVVPSAPSPTAVAPQLSWTAVVDGNSGLQAYRIYRSTTSGVLGSLVGSTAATTWSDPDTLVDDTTYWYTVQAIDNVGNEQAVGNTQIAVVYASAAPSGSSITIAGGAGVIATDSVTLTLASANAVEMLISDAPDFSGATWEPFSATRGWTLPAGDGTKSVYARFRNAGGTVSSAVVDTIDLDTTAPSPDPPTGTGTATGPTSVAWTISAATDAIAGLGADPYSFDGGTSWQATTSTTQGSLAPNTTYVVDLRARDALGNVTAAGSASATTHAASPAVTSTPLPDPGDQPRGTTFTFTNDAGWGPGAVEYYRWTWNTNAVHVFTGTEAIWGSGTLARQELVAGTYYMHVQAFNSEDVAGQQLTLGPYNVAPPQSQADLEVNLLDTQTISCAADDFTTDLLPGDSDDATVDCTVTSSLAGWNVTVHADSAPFFTDFLDAALTPAAYAPPAAADAQVAFTVEGGTGLPAFGGGSLWRGFDGATDVQIASDPGTSAGDVVTTRVRAELGAAAALTSGTRTQTLTFTINPGV